MMSLKFLTDLRSAQSPNYLANSRFQEKSKLFQPLRNIEHYTPDQLLHNEPALEQHKKRQMCAEVVYFEWETRHKNLRSSA